MCSAAARLVATATACVLVAACTWLRTSGQSQEGPPATGGARVIPCVLSEPIVGAFRRSPLERHWRELEKDVEQPLRRILSAQHTPHRALESLDKKILQRHDWTLTRYLVRLLRELKATDLNAARTLLQTEAYAQHALSKAMWDGSNGWDVVDGVRSETLEVLAWIEDVRTSRTPVANQHDTSGVPLSKEAQAVTERLFKAAAEREPYFVGSNCKEPEDPTGP
jgi:hypothetical protein